MERLYGITILISSYPIQALQILPHYNRKDGIMNATTPPLFSEFMALKRANPNQYWLPVTAAEMAKAYIHHGPAYFDLHKDKSI